MRAVLHDAKSKCLPKTVLCSRVHLRITFINTKTGESHEKPNVLQFILSYCFLYASKTFESGLELQDSTVLYWDQDLHGNLSDVWVSDCSPIAKIRSVETQSQLNPLKSRRIAYQSRADTVVAYACYVLSWRDDAYHRPNDCVEKSSPKAIPGSWLIRLVWQTLIGWHTLARLLPSSLSLHSDTKIFSAILFQAECVRAVKRAAAVIDDRFESQHLFVHWTWR